MTGRVTIAPLGFPVRSPELEAAAGLLDEYRQHYGQGSSLVLTRDWLADHLERRGLGLLLAALDGAPVGFATTYSSPATLILRHVWHLRDLYVIPAARRHGVGVALVEAVRTAAAADGAVRLSLQTEPGNTAALDLYLGLGFAPVDGVLSLTLPLR